MDSVLAIWPEDQEEMRFMEIHRALLEKGVVEEESHRYKTDRILKWLIKEGYIEKVGRGRYKITVKPEEFKLFEYLLRIRDEYRDKKLNFSSRVGGFVWAMNETHHLGMPEEILDHGDARFCLSILGIRIARIFQALKALAITVKRRRESDDRIPLPGGIVRQILVELIPWHIGSKIGPDLDGLYITDLHQVIGQIIDNLPESVTDGEWESKMGKKDLKRYYEMSSALMNETLDYLSRARERELHQEREYMVDYKDRYHFAMIITEPEYLIDEDAHEKRYVYELLEELAAEEELSDLFIASSLPLYDPDNARAVLNKYGNRLLGRKRAAKISDLFEKMWASDLISRYTGTFLPQREEIPPEIFEAISDLEDKGHTQQDMIRYLGFSTGSINYVTPTKEKMKLLFSLFPDLSKKELTQLYLEGVKKARKIANLKLKRLSSSFKETKE